jgi:hypothetical protein
VPESVEWPPAIGLSTAKAQRLLAQLGDWRHRAGSKQARTKGGGAHGYLQSRRSG